MLYYEVQERTNTNDVVSRQRYTKTYQKEQTLMTPYPDNVIHYDVPERTNAYDAVSRQCYT